MQSVNEALRLIKRSAELSELIRQRGGAVSLAEEEELLRITEKLQRLPAAVDAIVGAAMARRRHPEQLTAAEVLDHDRGQVA